MKPTSKKILKLSVFFCINILFFFSGMYAYKNENIRTKILSVSHLKNVSYKNYNLGKNSNPKSIELIIPDSSKTIINQCRENAIKDGILRDENKIDEKTSRQNQKFERV